MLFDTNSNTDLLWGDNASIAAYLGVSEKTVARYKAQPDKLPETARRLLKLRYGDLSGLLDSSWEGFTFHQGELFHPFYKNGFSADEVKGWFYGRRELEALRRDVKTLKLELKTLRAELDEARRHVWAAEKLRGILTPMPSRFAAAEPPACPPVPPPSGTPGRRQ